MRTIITLALFLIIGLVGTRGMVARATRRLPLAGLLATGMEFFLLGVLLGPGVLNVITDDVMQGLKPVVYLALGWVGLLFGVEISWDRIRRISGKVFRVLAIDSAASLAIFSALSYFVIQFMWPHLEVAERTVAATVFGITAATSSPTIIALVSQRLPARGPFTNTIKTMSALSSLFPLLGFGLLFMVVHPRFFGFAGIGNGMLWWVIVNLVGVMLGFLMVLFAQERTGDDEMGLIIVGTVLVVGGVCYYLQFSSLYTAMVMGFVVGNFSRRRDQIFRELHVFEKTVFVGFLLLVGAMVGLPDPWTVAVVAVYVVMRAAMKYFVAGRLLTWGFPETRESGRGPGLAFSGQGVMAIAIALDFALVTSDAVMNSVLTVVAFAVMLNDVIGYALVRRVLRSSGEVRPARRARAGRAKETGE